MKYDKLVRDKIPEYIKGKGGKFKIHTADDWEYWLKLKEKLQEEVYEFIGNEDVEELVDVLEVIDAICDHQGFDKKKLYEVKEKKARERGRFKKKIILEES